MKVYIVFTNDGESEEILQVYGTEQDAQELVKDNEERWPALPYYYKEYTVQNSPFEYKVKITNARCVDEPRT